MHVLSVRHFLLIVICMISTPALAGVGGTSAGVTTSIPTQSTDPSAGVQGQSSSFVQQNQQLQNAGSPTGIAMPGTAGTSGTTATTAAQRNGATTDASGKPSDPQRPGDQAAAQPATPPPPPPTYVSTVKHLKPATQDTTTVPVAVAQATPTPVPDGQPKADPPPAATVPPPAAVPAPHAPVRAIANDANGEKHPAANHAGVAPAIAGGSGEAPDGITFYVGLGIATLLLAVAAAAYLRTQRDDAARRAGG